MPDEPIGKLTFGSPRPSWRALRVPFEKLESALRRLNRDYDLEHAIYAEGQYTLLFKLRSNSEGANGTERILRETHAQETSPEENRI